VGRVHEGRIQADPVVERVSLVKRPEVIQAAQARKGFAIKAKYSSSRLFKEAPLSFFLAMSRPHRPWLKQSPSLWSLRTYGRATREKRNRRLKTYGWLAVSADCSW
jgi:hypothetical protein